MTTARNQQISLDVTPWYHCTTRCVRRAYLCGYDVFTKSNFDHRRKWIEDRILLLSSVFCIDIGAYAIMSNHYHVVLRVDCEKSKRLSDFDVVSRWSQIYSGTAESRKLLEGLELTTIEQQSLLSSISKWRAQLANISRFMAEVNQYIARRANKEDDCKGKFWEARFDSQALLDNDALLRTLVYVDLNPLRAKMADRPENSDFTSLKRRLTKQESGLIAFKDVSGVKSQKLPTDSPIPISFEAYIELVDWTSRLIISKKRGQLSRNSPPIFERLSYSAERWVSSMEPKITWQQKALGRVERILDYCSTLNRRWIWQATEHYIGP